MSPNKVMPLMAIPISSSLAWMAGAVAAMADAPHMDVPTPMSIASLFDNPSLLPNVMLMINETNIITKALTAPIPTSNQTDALVTSPSKAIVNFNNWLLVNLSPVCSFSGILTILIIMMPKMKLHIKELIGLYWVQTANPKKAIVIANKTPGMCSTIFTNSFLNAGASKIRLQ
jgi:hypothetical protein